MRVHNKTLNGPADVHGVERGGASGGQLSFSPLDSIAFVLCGVPESARSRNYYVGGSAGRGFDSEGRLFLLLWRTRVTQKQELLCRGSALVLASGTTSIREADTIVYQPRDWTLSASCNVDILFELGTGISSREQHLIPRKI